MVAVPYLPIAALLEIVAENLSALFPVIVAAIVGTLHQPMVRELEDSEELITSLPTLSSETEGALNSFSSVTLIFLK